MSEREVHMAINYCKLHPHRFDLVLDKYAEGGGDREALLKAVGEHE